MLDHREQDQLLRMGVSNHDAYELAHYRLHTDTDEQGSSDGSTNGNQLNLSVVETTVKLIGILSNLAILGGNNSVDVVNVLARKAPLLLFVLHLDPMQWIDRQGYTETNTCTKSY